LLMVLASIAIVMCFESLGAILVIAFLVLPPAMGRLFCSRFFTIYAAAMLFSAITIFGGIKLSLTWNLNVGATVSSLQFLLFLLAFLFKGRHRRTVAAPDLKEPVAP